MNPETQCMGCYRLGKEIMEEDSITEEELERESVQTNAGDYYCHSDCFRDSH